MRRLALCLPLLGTSAFAAEPPKLPSIPFKPLAETKALLFSDDLNGGERDGKWHPEVHRFVVERAELKGTQAEVKDEPSQDGRSII